MQTGLCDRCCIEAAFESEAGFFRCVIKSADNEVFTIMPLRTPPQFFVLMREPLDNFRPGDVRSESRTSENAAGRKAGDQVPKSDLTGPPIKTSMGSFFHSYS